jgi:four helix bundle protein
LKVAGCRLNTRYMAKVNTFEDLEIWKEGIEIAVEIYNISKQGELGSDFGLRDQIRRSAVSISANIAEGFEYDNNNDFVRFLTYSKGSTGELRSHLAILEKTKYLSKDEAEKLKGRLKMQSKKTSSLIKYLKGYQQESKKSKTSKPNPNL